jgi:hypothetical protein
MTTPITVEEITRSALDGDRDALDTLVRALQGDVYGLALRMLWNREDAEDATQGVRRLGSSPTVLPTGAIRPRCANASAIRVFRPFRVEIERPARTPTAMRALEPSALTDCIDVVCPEDLKLQAPAGQNL